MKRRILCALCAAALCVGLLLLPAAGGEEVYQLVINDRFFDAELNSATMPVSLGGVVYVPYTVFDKSVTGVDFGISYGQKREGGEYILSLYSINGVAVFDLNRGTATDRLGGSLNMRAILRGGRVFVPIRAVCDYFNNLAGATLIQYVFSQTDYGVLIRLRNSQAVLSDFQFCQVGESALRTRYNRYLQSVSPNPSAVPSGQQTSSPAPSASPDPDTAEHLRIFLAFRYTGGGNAGKILDTLSAYGAQALFLFAPEELSAVPDLVRRIVGEGHSLGLVVPGESEEAALAALAEGNALLERLAWTRSHICLAEGASPAVRQTLASEGWHCWLTQVDGRTGSSSAALARRILSAAEERERLARITMDDSALCAGALSSLLTQLRRAGHSVRPAVESEF